MERINGILSHKLYQEAMKKIEHYEKERIYCKHGFSHQMDVARIAYILYLEETSVRNPWEKERIYVAALLHDIGRGLEYEGKMPHERAGESLAGQILKDCGFQEKEAAAILEFIGNHRDGQKQETSFCRILKQADHLSRNCFMCQAQETCKWSETKKNKEIRY